MILLAIHIYLLKFAIESIHTNTHNIMPRLLYLCLLIPVLTLCACSGDDNKCRLPEAELRRLDAAITSTDHFEHSKSTHIDSLCKALGQYPGSTPESWLLNMRLGREFLQSNPDSALFYYRRAIAIASDIDADSLRTIARIGRVRALSGAGIFTEAEREINNLSAMPLASDQRIMLWTAGRYLFSYMHGYADSHTRFAAQCFERYRQYDDSLLNALPDTAMFRRFIRAERLVSEGKFRQARAALKAIMAGTRVNDNIHGMAAYQMAKTYLETDDMSNYTSYLAQSALSDEQACVREGLALPSLASLLYERGDFDRAFRYLNYAMQSANSSHARMRTVALARMMPSIDEAYRQKINASRDTMLVSLLIVIIVLVAAAVLLVMVIIQARKRHAASRQLAELSRRQDTYIGHFLGLCSTYSAKIESMAHIVERKISSGHADDLLRMAHSGRLAGERNEDIFQMFDDTFLDLYPDFISQINTLLRPDEQLPVPAGDSLTTELRIYALVRLGVSESKTISQVLHISPATVYTYRNRMRNRAINRDTFDADIMDLCRHD